MRTVCVGGDCVFSNAVEPSEEAELADQTFYLVTFGCRVNQADSAGLRADFLYRQYREVQNWNKADVIVVNSCTVTHRADQQVRQLVRKFRRYNAAARIIVTGCYAQRDPQAIAQVAGVDLVAGNTRKHEIFDWISMNRPQVTAPDEREMASIYWDDFSKGRISDATSAHQTGGRTRPFVKIQDGCDAKCRYCIIPKVRGPSRSVPPDQVLDQVRQLVSLGFREVVLTGIHLGTYGMHLTPHFPLDRLLEGITAINGLERVRISSIEPMELPRRIIELVVTNEKIAPHFHICLQSGSNRILRRMLRPYDTRRFAAVVEEIRERLPEAGIGTDLIVGFPGESEEDHYQTREFAERMPFTYIHVFPYSDRQGTPAAEMQDKVSETAKKRRGGEIREISEEKNRRFRRSFVGRRLSVLTLSQEKQGKRTALAGNYLKAKVELSVPANRIIHGWVEEEREGYLFLKTSHGEASGVQSWMDARGTL